MQTCRINAAHVDQHDCNNHIIVVLNLRNKLAAFSDASAVTLLRFAGSPSNRSMYRLRLVMALQTMCQKPSIEPQQLRAMAGDRCVWYCDNLKRTAAIQQLMAIAGDRCRQSAADCRYTTTHGNSGLPLHVVARQTAADCSCATTTPLSMFDNLYRCNSTM